MSPKDSDNASMKEGRHKPALSFLKRLADPTPLKRDRVIDAVVRLAESKKVALFIVGGSIRNLVLSRPLAPDYDFVMVTGDDDKAIGEFSALVATCLGGTAFVLDKETPSYRVAVNAPAPGFTVDLSPVMSADIIADLKQRDFTVNAMAVEAAAIVQDGDVSVIDPCEGMEDAAAGLVRMTSARVFDSDPLRCLRAVRLQVQYSLALDADTAAAIRAEAGSLERTSPERIRDELVAIFEAGGASAGLKALFDLGIAGAVLKEIKGWGDIGGYDLLEHSLKTVDEAESILNAILEDKLPGLPSEVKERFSGSMGGVRRSALFKMAAFFHDIGKEKTISRASGRLRFIGHDCVGASLLKDMLTRLRFSRRVAGELAALVKNHHRVFTLAGLENPSTRAKAHLFSAAGGADGGLGLDLLFLALADARATRGSEGPGLASLVEDMLEFYYGTYLKKSLRPVLDGDEIMETFGVKQGRLVGEIIACVSEGVESGLVKNRSDAVELVKNWLAARKES